LLVGNSRAGFFLFSTTLLIIYCGALFNLLGFSDRFLNLLTHLLRSIMAFFYRDQSTLLPGYKFYLGFCYSVTNLLLDGVTLRRVFSPALLIILCSTILFNDILAFLLLDSRALLFRNRLALLLWD